MLGKLGGVVGGVLGLTNNVTAAQEAETAKAAVNALQTTKIQSTINLMNSCKTMATSIRI